MSPINVILTHHMQYTHIHIRTRFSKKNLLIFRFVLNGAFKCFDLFWYLYYRGTRYTSSTIYARCNFHFCHHHHHVLRAVCVLSTSWLLMEFELVLKRLNTQVLKVLVTV
jgi:hypothetical protein